MNRRDLVEKIKNQLKSLIQSEQKFAEQKSGDKLLTTPDEMFVVGSEIFMRDEDGNNKPVLDGDYTFDNGVKIVVEGGKIKSMTSEDDSEDEEELQKYTPEEKEKMEEEKDKEKMKEDDKEKMKEDGKEKEEMTQEEKMKECMEKIQKMEEKIEKMGKRFEEVEKEKEKMKVELQKISNQPSTQKIEGGNAEFKSIEEKSTSLAPDMAVIRERVRKNNR